MKSPTVTLTCLLIIAAACSLRFFGLDGKVYWIDESQSSLRMTGFTEKEMVQELSALTVFHPLDVLKYQSLGDKKNWSGTITSCATEDPLQPPLYYLLMRLWCRLFSSTVVAIRTLSVVSSIVALFGVFLLTRELFASYQTALIATALSAVSPIQMLFAQEARPYALLFAAMAFSTLYLLRALRSHKISDWLIYTFLIATALYLQPIFLLFIASQATFTIVGQRRSQLNRTVKPFLAAAVVALAAFLPWIMVMVKGAGIIHRRTAWLTYPIEPAKLVQLQLRNLAANLVDVSLPWSDARYLFFALVVLVIGFSYYRLVKSAPARASFFITLMVIFTSLPVVLLDLFSGGMRSIIARYFLASNLAFTLTVAFWLSYGLGNSKRRKRHSFVAASLVVLGLGFLSCAQIAATPIWWNKPINRNTIAMAGFLNSLDHPLLICSYSQDDIDLSPLMTLSYFLRPRLCIQLRCDDAAPPQQPGFSDYLLYMPGEKYRSLIAQSWHQAVIPLDKTGELYLIRPFKEDRSMPQI